MEFLMIALIPFAFIMALFGYDDYSDEQYVVPKKEDPTLYINKTNDVEFIEITRYDTESVMLRTDINTRLLIKHTELEKSYTKKV